MDPDGELPPHLGPGPAWAAGPRSAGGGQAGLTGEGGRGPAAGSSSKVTVTATKWPARVAEGHWHRHRHRQYEVPGLGPGVRVRGRERLALEGRREREVQERMMEGLTGEGGRGPAGVVAEGHRHRHEVLVSPGLGESHFKV